MHLRRITLVAAVFAMAAPVMLPPAGAQDGELLEESWHALFLMGQKAGHMHEAVFEHRTADGVEYETRVRQELAISRAQVSIRVSADLSIREDAEGRVLGFRKAIAGMMTQTQEGHVEGDEMVITSRTGFGSRTNRVARHEGLGPHALDRLQQRMGYEPGTEYTAKLFLPDAPSRAMTGRVRVVGVEEVPFFETTKQLHRVEVQMPELPALTATEWHDSEGQVWAARMGMGGIEVFLLRASRAVATAEAEPAELMASTFVRPDRRIRDPRQLEGLVVLMQPEKVTIDQLAIPEDTYQKVQKRRDGVLVSVTRAHGRPELSYRLPYSGDEFADQTQANAWLETDDPAIRRMAAEAVGDATDALTAAKRIEAYVDRTISAKGLGVGMATAAETAASREGDCSEHAVLVAAVARAAGMPSRVVGGLVYGDSLPGMGPGAFGYHMWAEVWVGEWLPLDAAIRPHDATHIALTRSDLNGPDDLFNMSAAIMQVLAAVELRVIQTTYL